MSKIVRISVTNKVKNPNLNKLYSKYDEIKLEDCDNLLVYLYEGKRTDWINPITGIGIKKTSDIIISFLSKCYYIWGNNSGFYFLPHGAQGSLTYKEHILKFIDKEYLFDLSHLINSPASPAGATIIQPIYIQQVINKPKTPIILNVPAKKKSSSSPGAATNAPKSPRMATSSSHKLQFAKKSDSDASILRTMKNANNLKESDCIAFVNEMKDKMRDKTARQITQIKVNNPITNKEIGIDSPIIKSYLVKCYYGFDNQNIKKVIDEIVNIKDLDNFKDFADKDKKAREEKRLREEKEKEEKRLREEKEKEENIKRRPIIEEYINERIADFYKLCDELEDKCDPNGILENHKYISNIVEAIIVIIYTKYLHLNILYDDFDFKKSITPLKIYMYDETFHDYYASRQLKADVEFKKTYDSYKIIYQDSRLRQSLDNKLIDIYPKTVETYYLNTLYNRQYVFELVNYSDFGDFNNPTIRYNRINNIDEYAKIFKHQVFPKTLNFANNMISSSERFNYNITNSVLPKYIFYEDPFITKYFPDIIDLINTKLQKLPTIKGFAKEVTVIQGYYENILKDMKDKSFGNNETEYGGDDMIRKNILYSLNAQTPSYINKNFRKVIYETYYNTEYTGTFPIFTWIPLNPSIQDTIYNFPSFESWQPLKINQPEIKKIESAYKNKGMKPWSALLNGTIYKVITDEYKSVHSLPPNSQFGQQTMEERIIDTLGIYKDEHISSSYTNKKIYLYHGTKNRLHNINGKERDIEMLGFLSTSLNIYTASYYSGVGETNSGFIYIIEVDYTQKYINLNDLLYQIILLPYSVIRIIHEFNFGAVRVILCRLIRTPSKKQNNLLYNKLLDIDQEIDINSINYRIKINNNASPVCAYILGDLWKEDVVNDSKYLELYKIQRNKLNNKMINDKRMLYTELKDEFAYFSLGQECELYVARGLPLFLGSFADIKYSIHQHFIKDCYKALDIPCLDYIFIHGTQKAKTHGIKRKFVKNAISTGILLQDYKKNRINSYKYDVNNFLIDCIFKFNSVKHDNKKLNLPIDNDDNDDTYIYADKIEGFRDAGLYLHGDHNPLFNIDTDIGEHIQYLRDWKQMFAKYKNASDVELEKHFMWCNKRIKKLIEIIKKTHDNYLAFVNNTLKQTSFGQEFNSQILFNVQIINDMYELNKMIRDLSNTLIKRCEYYIKCTASIVRIQNFTRIIRFVLEEQHINTYNSKLYNNPVLEDLILYEDKRDSGSLSGGILSIKQINKQGMQLKAESDKTKAIDHNKIYEAFKNVPISETKDMRKFKDMPKIFQEYYKSSKGSNDRYININNYCNFRFV